MLFMMQMDSNNVILMSISLLSDQSTPNNCAAHVTLTGLSITTARRVIPVWLSQQPGRYRIERCYRSRCSSKSSSSDGNIEQRQPLDKIEPFTEARKKSKNQRQKTTQDNPNSKLKTKKRPTNPIRLYR